MTLIIDSVTPNTECIETPPAAPRTDRCVVEARYHIRRDEGGATTAEEGTEPLSFYREIGGGDGPNFYVSSSALTSRMSGLITEHRFDPTQASLVHDIRNIVRIRIDYSRGRVLFSEYDRLHHTEYARLFDDVINYLFLGEIDSPDPVQQAFNQSLFSRLGAVPTNVLENFRITAGSFLLDNREWLQREDETALPRAERLAFIWNFCRRVREGLEGLPADSPLQGRLLALQGALMGHAFSGEPSLTALTAQLSPLALDLYGETPPASPESGDEAARWNLYHILAPALETLSGSPPFQTAGEAQTRLQTLIRLLNQPSQTHLLEYSLLEPRPAFERSLLDSFSEETGREEIVAGFEDLINAPDFSADWLGDNGHLREILDAILAGVRVSGSPARLTLDSTAVRSHLETLFSNHSIQHREFVAGSLAVLRYLTGREAVQAYWDGQMRSIPWNLSPADRRALESMERWLRSQIETSLTETDLILPLVEGGLCLAGAGLLTWGLLDNPRADTVSPQVVAGSGTIGLGCGALATHFMVNTRNEYIADAVGGGIGTLLGVGISLLVYFLGGAFNSGSPMPPLDGRNPVEGWGP